jgi:hypothetical protein
VSPPTNPKTGNALVTFWYDQTTYVDGLCQETCRDLGHVQYGLAALIDAAETALIQGVDLYGEEQARLVAGLEFHANCLQGATVPSWLCGGTLTDVKFDPMWEIAVNELSTVRAGKPPDRRRSSHGVGDTDPRADRWGEVAARLRFQHPRAAASPDKFLSASSAQT